MPHLGQFAILGLVEGLTEFIPVSSTGHLILARTFLGIGEDNGLAIDAVLQLATTLALVVYFWKDLWKLAQTFFNFVLRKPMDPAERKLMVAIIVGTVPGVILGLLLEHTMETVFRSALIVAWTAIIGAVVMAAAEFLSKRNSSPKDVSDVGAGKGLLVGLFQSIALLPGMSRSAMVISGGMFLGLSRDAATRFGFLLAVPILAGSGAKKLLDLAKTGTLGTIGPELFVGCVVAFVAGLASIHALILFVRKNPLYPFVIYRIILGATLLFVL